MTLYLYISAYFAIIAILGCFIAWVDNCARWY